METYVPEEVVVSQILPRLPVRSLLRFRCVCQAWRDAIIDDDDGSFRREHLRLGKTSILLAPHVRDCSASYQASKVVTCTTVGLYRWEPSHGAATLLHGLAEYHTFRGSSPAHGLAHCDGLVLVPSEASVRVVNPATRRVCTLPWSHRMIMPRGAHSLLKTHQAFGLGHDPISNTYKVARFFYITLDIRDDHYSLGMEIFTVGTDQIWRDIKHPSPYPLMAGQTATFCGGSLIWTIEHLLLKDKKSIPGFVRLSLADESFGVVPPPPCYRSTRDIGAVSELRGELCLVHSGPTGIMSLEIWMCRNLDGNPPQWDRRYVIALDFPILYVKGVCPKAMFDDEIVFKHGYHLFRYNYRARECVTKDMVMIHDLRYENPDDYDGRGTLVEYRRSNLLGINVIPYVPSLTPI